jgi:hypothetical protein
VFDYEAPLALLGIIANKLFLERYLRRLLAGRAALIRRAAESADPVTPKFSS